MEINTNTHYLVVDADGNVLKGENDASVLVQSLEGEIYSICIEEAEAIFGVKLQINVSSASLSAKTPPLEIDDQERNAWTKQDTLALLTEYKNHEKVFASSTVRNKTVWQRIAGIIKHHNATQCENRMKYLKNQYIKKRESMGSTNSGGTSIRCSFFEELDDIFGQRPSVKPVAIASSSHQSDKPQIVTARRAINSVSNSESDDEEEKVKTKKSKFEIQLQNFEKSRQKRHEDNMKKKDEALQLFKEFSTNILNILKEKNKKSEEK